MVHPTSDDDDSSRDLGNGFVGVEGDAVRLELSPDMEQFQGDQIHQERHQMDTGRLEGWKGRC